MAKSEDEMNDPKYYKTLLQYSDFVARANNYPNSHLNLHGLIYYPQTSDGLIIHKYNG
jgi:hypothetical protein